MIRDDLRLDPPVQVPFDGIFADLDIAPFEFFLAGSRYMGMARPDSDWDFLAQDSVPTRNHLTRIGFRSMVQGYYDISVESNTSHIYEYKGPEGLKVQVQLQRDVQKQRAVRDIIKTYMLEAHTNMNRYEREDLWNGLYWYLSMKGSGRAL